MQPIRVAMGVMPRLLRDVVVDIMTREPDLLLVGEASAEGELDELLKSSGANVLLCTAHNVDSPAKRERLLHEHAGLRLLVLSDHGRTADVYWLEPHTAWSTDVSSENLVRLIRSSFSGGTQR